MVSWLGSRLILARLKPEGYRFSDLFYPAMYTYYWEIAPQRGWSRVPAYTLLIPFVYGSLSLLLCVFTDPNLRSLFPEVPSTFLGNSWLFWLFAALCVASAEGSLVLLNLIRKQLNRVMPGDKKAILDPPWPRSSKELLLGTRLWPYLRELLERHRKFYPTSSLRKAVMIALAGTLAGFIGLALSSRWINWG
jgi:hypothetical protein